MNTDMDAPGLPLWAGTLSQLLLHQETGCPHAARHALRLLQALCTHALDADVRQLCERACQRLEHTALQPPARSANRKITAR